MYLEFAFVLGMLPHGTYSAYNHEIGVRALLLLPPNHNRRCQIYQNGGGVL